MSNDVIRFSKGDKVFVMAALRKAGPHNEPVTGVVVYASPQRICVNLYGREFWFRKSSSSPAYYVEENGKRVALTSWDAILEYQDEYCA